MYLLAEITIKPGTVHILDSVLEQHLLPIVKQAGWELVASMRPTQDETRICNVWNVNDALDAGIDMIRNHADYPIFSAKLAECIESETLVPCEAWWP